MQTNVRAPALRRAPILILAMIAILLCSCAKHKEPQPSKAEVEAAANFIEAQQRTLNSAMAEENKETPAERANELTGGDNRSE